MYCSKRADLTLSTIGRAVLVLIVIAIMAFLLLKSLKAPNNMLKCPGKESCVKACEEGFYHYSPGDEWCRKNFGEGYICCTEINPENKES